MEQFLIIFLGPVHSWYAAVSTAWRWNICILMLRLQSRGSEDVEYSPICSRPNNPPHVCVVAAAQFLLWVLGWLCPQLWNHSCAALYISHIFRHHCAVCPQVFSTWAIHCPLPELCICGLSALSAYCLLWSRPDGKAQVWWANMKISAAKIWSVFGSCTCSQSFYCIKPSVQHPEPICEL